MSETLVTPVATLSFPAIFEAKNMPKETDPSKRKFSCQLIFDGNANLQAIMAEIQRVATEKYPNGLPPGFRLPLVRGEVKNPKEPLYAGKWLMNANAKLEYPPQVLDASRQPVLDRSQVYAGCKVVAGVRFYAYDAMGNKGVGCGLVAVMKVGDGERLDTSVNVDTLFASVPLPVGAPAPVATNFAPQQGVAGQAANPFPW